MEKDSNNPLYAYSLDTIKLSGVTSDKISEEVSDPTMYAPDSFISGAKLWKDFKKSYDPGKELLAENEKKLKLPRMVVRHIRLTKFVQNPP